MNDGIGYGKSIKKIAEGAFLSKKHVVMNILGALFNFTTKMRFFKEGITIFLLLKNLKMFVLILTPMDAIQKRSGRV